MKKLFLVAFALGSLLAPAPCTKALTPFKYEAFRAGLTTILGGTAIMMGLTGIFDPNRIKNEPIRKLLTNCLIGACVGAFLTRVPRFDEHDAQTTPNPTNTPPTPSGQNQPAANN